MTDDPDAPPVGLDGGGHDPAPGWRADGDDVVERPGAGRDRDRQGDDDLRARPSGVLSIVVAEGTTVAVGEVIARLQRERGSARRRARPADGAATAERRRATDRARRRRGGRRRADGRPGRRRRRRRSGRRRGAASPRVRRGPRERIAGRRAAARGGSRDRARRVQLGVARRDRDRAAGSTRRRRAQRLRTATAAAAAAPAGDRRAGSRGGTSASRSPGCSS